MVARWPKKTHWASKRCLTKNEGSALALRNSGSLNNACLKCTNKTLHIKVWQSERWAWRRLLQFLLEELERRFPLLMSPSQREISPKSLLAEASCQKCSLSTVLFPLLSENDSPVRKHVCTAVLWETPGEGIVPNLCELSHWGNTHRLSCWWCSL